MADRFPLIANTSANQIQELSASDNLDLTGNSIVGLSTIAGGTNITGVVTATSAIVGSAVTMGESGVDVTGIVTSTSFSGSAASLTSIPAANIVGLATAGFERTGGFGGGKILKVLQAVKTSGQDITSSSFTDITDLSITLTPAATSKCLVHAVVTGYGEWSSTYFGNNKMQIVRGSTSIGVDLRTIRMQTNSSTDYLQTGSPLTQTILDTHGADGSTAVTYKCQGLTNSGHMYVNSSYSTYSSLTVYEVAPN